MDRISQLPDAIKVDILERLPFIEAVRTSVLSSNWRFKWAEVTSLELDAEFHSTVSRAQNPLLLYEEIISSIFLQVGSLCSLFLSIPCREEDHQPVSPVYSHFIQFALRNGVKNLSVDYNGSSPFYFPSRVFSCVDLTHLFLSECDFHLPSSFRGLPNLLSLQVATVVGETVEQISRLVSGCPKLEVLALFRLDSAVVINDPKLLFLAVTGWFDSLTLKYAPAPNITRLDVRWEALLNKVPKLEKAKFDGYFCKVLACTGALLSPWRLHLFRKLTICDMDLNDGDQLKCLLNMLDNSPNMKELKIVMIMQIN